VAGFDYEFSYLPEQRPYVVACERISKVRARTLLCSWRTSHDEGGRTATYSVSGQTRRLDLLGRVLELDLPLVCQGVDGALSPGRAFELGVGIADLFLVGRDINRGEGRLVLRSRKETSLYYPVYELASGRAGLAMLEARLRISEDVLADYALGRVEDTVALEELHTAVEKVMRAAVAAEQRLNWPELRRRCGTLGLLPNAEEYALVTHDAEAPNAHAHTPDGVLSELAERRNRAKHEPRSATDGWLRTHWECVAIIIETLTNHLGTLGGRNPPT
jgi:hypothetical protein